MGYASIRVFIAMIVLILASSILSARAATTDNSAFERLKKQIRDASATNPAEAELVIKQLEVERAELERSKEHPEEIEQDLIALVDRMKNLNAPSKRLEFADARTALEKKIEWYTRNKVFISAQIGNKISDEVLNIYEKRAGTQPGDSLPITVAAKIANSPRSKKYLIQVLNGSSEELRLHALIELAWSQNLKGDKEIFDALAKRREVDDKNSGALLGTMSRLDRQRALPILLSEIGTTNDIKRFTQDSDILSEYGRVDLLDHPLARIKDFPKVGLVDKRNPTLGISPELLLRYIGTAEGAKLDSALLALEQSVEALQKCEPLIMTKLRSSKSQTRRYTAEFLKRMRGTPLIQESTNLNELERLKSRESDSVVKEALDEILSEARKKKH